MAQKVAICSGIRGQDASYLSELLLSKGYKVIGTERRSGNPNYTNIKHLIGDPNFIIEQGDVTDFGSITRILKLYQPDEFYNLAAQSFVAASWDQPITTGQINYLGPANCLEAIRLISPKTRFFQASTSECYGDVVTEKQNEQTPARPRSPYAASKYGAESLVKVYRDSYGLFACFARSFNHESPRRGKQFVTRKITSWIGEAFNLVEQAIVAPITSEAIIPVEAAFSVALNKNIIKQLHLGNLDVKRDWSDARDIVRGIWMMMQSDKPDDYVLASGQTHSIRDFLTEAFGCIGIQDWNPYVIIDPKFYRPADVEILCGDYTKAKTKLNWEPSISFKELVKDMIQSDIESYTNDRQQ